MSFYPYSSFGKGLHSLLSTPFPALNTNKNPAQYVKVISTRCLNNYQDKDNTMLILNTFRYLKKILFCIFIMFFLTGNANSQNHYSPGSQKLLDRSLALLKEGRTEDMYHVFMKTMVSRMSKVLNKDISTGFDMKMIMYATGKDKTDTLFVTNLIASYWALSPFFDSDTGAFIQGVNTKENCGRSQRAFRFLLASRLWLSENQGTLTQDKFQKYQNDLFVLFEKSLEPLVNIQFDSNSYQIKENEKNKISCAIGLVSAFKDYVTNIRIIGHTDSHESQEMSRTLSLNRADAVKKFLISKEVPDNLIESIGSGEMQPIASNETPDGRTKNRRVKIDFIVDYSKSLEK